jgi:hypothetical protein
MNHYYGKPLAASIKDGVLTIEIGTHVLAHSAAYADWANPYDEKRNDYIRTFAIVDPEEFAKDVIHAMNNEREDGSTPLSDFLDKMMEAALDDGTLGALFEQRIKHGTFSKREKWAKAAAQQEPTP